MTTIERGFAFKPREPMATSAAELAHEQRRRLEKRAKLLPRRSLGPVCAVVGGRGVNRRLSVMLAPLIADVSVEIGGPFETADRVAELTIREPRVVVFAPASEAASFVVESIARGWTTTDMLRGLRSADRQALLRHMLRVAREVRV